MAFNLSTLEIELSKKISTATDPYDILVYSKVLEKLKHNLISTVSTFSNMSNASINGELVYVEDEKILYAAALTDGVTIWRRLLDDYSSLIYNWGNNVNGQLGDNSTTASNSPKILGAPLSRLSAGTVGSNFSFGLMDGTVWAWGSNSSGKLGDGTSVDKSSPVSVVGGFTDWCQVSAGNAHTLAVRTNGTAWGWGTNTNGRLGDSTTTTRSSPVSVVGGFTDWCQVSAGANHSIGLRSNCTVWGWGCNSFGQIGDGTIVSSTSPVSVVGGFTDWCQVSAGNTHTAAVRTNGTIWSWGLNNSGQLGDSTTISKTSPVSVVGGFTDWCKVSAGNSMSVAIRTNGTMWAWGSNFSGRLGNGTTVSKSSPVSVVGGFTDWCQASAGNYHSIAVRTNGTVWTWGCNACGQLGDGTYANSSSPVSVVGGFTDWCQVSAGCRNSLGIRKTML